MAYVAFDRQRVAALESAMHDAVFELWFLGCADPLAVSAVATLRSARQRLSDIWLPMVHGVSCCDALDVLIPVRLESDDLLDVMMRAMVVDHGWTVGDDVDLLRPPVDAGAWPPPSVDETRELAQQLEQGNLGDLTDTSQERTWLATELDMIAADPVLAAAFDTAFLRSTDLIKRLGSERLATARGPGPWERPHDARDDADIASIDAVDGGLAHVWAAVHGTDALPDLEKIDPYSAAAFVAQAHLSPAALAGVSFDILGRLTKDRPADGWPEEHAAPGPSSADLFFAALLATPGSSTPFVIAAATDPQRMWRTPADPKLAQQVAATGTDPANIGVGDAGTVVGAFIDYIRKNKGGGFDGAWGPRPQDSRAFLGNLVAPWLLQFSPLNIAWGTTDKEKDVRRERLKWVLGDHTAMDTLLGAQQQILDGLRASNNRTRTDATNYAGLVGMLTQLVVDQRVHDEEDRQHLWDTVWRVADVVVAAALTFTGVEPLLAPVIGAGVDQIYAEVTRQGWFNAPAPDKVRSKATYWQTRTSVSVAAVMVRSEYGRMMTSGELPAGMPPPPDPPLDTEDPGSDYANRFDTWLDDQRAGADPEVTGNLYKLADLNDTFANAFGAGADG
jgi:hypothetical protein